MSMRCAAVGTALALLSWSALADDAPAMQLTLYEALATAEEHLQAGQVDEALAVLHPLEEQAESDAERARVYDLTAWAFADGEDFANALAYNEKLLVLGSAAPTELVLDARENAAVAAALLGRFDDALRHGTAWQEDAEAPTDVPLYLADMLYERDAPRDAIALLEAAVEQTLAAGERNPEARLDRLFALLFHRRQFERALAVLEELHAAYPTDDRRQNIIQLKWKIHRAPKREERPGRPVYAPPPG